jgi:hypothetical protein
MPRNSSARTGDVRCPPPGRTPPFSICCPYCAAPAHRTGCAERDGLIVRTTRGDGSRRVDVELTAAGHVLVEELVDRVLGREAELVAHLDAVEQQQLTHLLRRLLDGLDDKLGKQKISQVGD